MLLKRSMWAKSLVSNLVIVPKKSGDLTVCCDLREVNKALVRERYVLSKVDDTLHALRGSKYFANIEAKGVFFFQLPLVEESRYIIAFIASRGCYLFKRTPFGLSDVWLCWEVYSQLWKYQCWAKGTEMVLGSVADPQTLSSRHRHSKP